MRRSRFATTLMVTATSALGGLLAGCTADGGSSPSPSPAETISATKLAIASLLPIQSVEPAPPGDTVVDMSGPYFATEVIEEPSRQVITCTPRELPPMDISGPPEPGAAGAASSGFVTGSAQVDQYAVVYTDQTAAEQAVNRSRAWTQDCQKAFKVHSRGAHTQAQMSEAPSSVAGFRVHASYKYPDTGHTSDEVSAVLRSGRIVLYLRANELGAPDSKELPADGLLDPGWTDDLIEAAAAHLAS